MLRALLRPYHLTHLSASFVSHLRGSGFGAEREEREVLAPQLWACTFAACCLDRYTIWTAILVATHNGPQFFCGQAPPVDGPMGQRGTYAIQMIPTPKFPPVGLAAEWGVHKTKKGFPTVYEPAEDTFLLLDTLQAERDSIRADKPLIFVEVGCGSGVVSAFVTAMLGPSACYLCTDIHHLAAECTLETATLNRISLCPVITDLVSAFLPRLESAIDLIIFNPPYVVTSSKEVGGSVETAWAGGKDGREVILRFLDKLPSLLAKGGRCYVVVLAQNDPEELLTKTRRKGLLASCVASRRVGIEHLFVLRFLQQ
uniref:methyltransferase N6AMT1 isoform X2 n=1 Tax=Myxine glutinosa TaxID=7769 RepID=UPI00358FFE21